MAILTVSNISKTYGIETILQNISFIVNYRDIIGIVGDNGAGKSTLLKLLVNLIEPDSGNISMSNINVGYLEQNAYIQSTRSIYDEVKNVFDDVLELENKIKEIEVKISYTKDKNELDKLLNVYSNYIEKFNEKDGFSIDSKVKGTLIGLGFSKDQFDTHVSILSGGQKTRLMLAKTLLKNPDLLLLDEPTNHLDIPSIEWLEQYLKSYIGTVMVISHDRYFLDKIANRIFEIENMTLNEYNGNYSYYVSKKSEELKVKEKAYEEQQKEIKRIQDMIMIQKNRRREKSVKMAESKQKMLDRMEKIEKPKINNNSIKISFDFDENSGNDILMVRDLSLSFDRQIFQNVSFDVLKGERIAILGPNGIGKTSLLKIIMGKIDNFSGNVNFGSNVVKGYYEQELTNLNGSKRIIDEIWDENTYLTQTEIRTLLGSFLFHDDDVFKKIEMLSGGEKARISLLKLILSKANFLLLDEPTNHLDLKSKEVLEKALLDYGGTVLFVSHDRYFIDKIATKVLELSHDGILEYHGNYTYYLEKKNESNNIDLKNNQDSLTKTQRKNEIQKEKEKIREKKKQNEYIKNLENEIIKTEDLIKELEIKMCDPEIYKNEEIINIKSKYDNLKDKLDKLYDEWDIKSG